MKKSFLFGFFLLLKLTALAQITGTVTNTADEALPYVNIYVANSFTGTTANDEGFYELNPKTTGEITVVFQFLGYETQKKQLEYTGKPLTVNVQLQEESTSLDEVVLNNKENPANRVIRKAIEYREANQDKIEAFTADFYSRGMWKIKNAPEKILGNEVGDLGGGLDSTRSGIVYLSETISTIKYQAPDDFHEKITASKVSGDDNGFSLNSARDANFSFYDNTIPINAEVVSPIADYAFNYYTYHLEGLFRDQNGKLINKIKVTPKRPNDRVFSGFIYIVEDDWQVYGVDLNTTGQAIQVAPIESLRFQQNFTYSNEHEFWVKRSQKVSFNWKILGIEGDGVFNAMYNNYDFSPNFTENTFSREIMSFEENANKKDTLFWNKLRPIPLTEEEQNDYLKKDSIQEIRESKPYLDSIDGVRNKFSVSDILMGYHGQNSYKGYSWGFEAPIEGLQYNTVQGWNLKLDTYFRKQIDDYNRFWGLFASVQYGFADERLRATGGFQFKMNNTSKAYLVLRGGSEVSQINSTNPIRPIENSIATLLFDKNYLKLYDRNFVEASYTEELWNGFRLYTNASFERRQALFNDAEIMEDEESYTSNNPWNPANNASAPFTSHNIAKLRVTGRINFAQEYYNYPDGKYNVTNTDYPTLYISYEKGFAASEASYNFDHIQLRAQQEISLQNKGDFQYLGRIGTFFNADGFSVLDYKHFNGNLTHVKLDEHIAQFNLLPYYRLSTDDHYAELHAEHNFKGWVLGKIPYINRLNFNLVAGAHAAFTAQKPYTEYSLGLDNIGFGKFRVLRVDYVYARQGNWSDHGVMFGLSLSF